MIKHELPSSLNEYPPVVPVIHFPHQESAATGEQFPEIAPVVFNALQNVIEKKREARGEAIAKMADFLDKPESKHAAGPDIKNETGLDHMKVLELGFGSFADVKKAAGELRAKQAEEALAKKEAQKEARRQANAARRAAKEAKRIEDYHAANEARAVEWRRDIDHAKTPATLDLENNIATMSYKDKLIAGGENGIKRMRAEAAASDTKHQAEAQTEVVRALSPYQVTRNEATQSSQAELVTALRIHNAKPSVDAPMVVELENRIARMSYKDMLAAGGKVGIERMRAEAAAADARRQAGAQSGSTGEGQDQNIPVEPPQSPNTPPSAPNSPESPNTVDGKDGLNNQAPNHLPIRRAVSTAPPIAASRINEAEIEGYGVYSPGWNFLIRSKSINRGTTDRYQRVSGAIPDSTTLPPRRNLRDFLQPVTERLLGIAGSALDYANKKLRRH